MVGYDTDDQILIHTANSYYYIRSIVNATVVKKLIFLTRTGFESHQLLVKKYCSSSTSIIFSSRFS